MWNHIKIAVARLCRQTRLGTLQLSVFSLGRTSTTMDGEEVDPMMMDLVEGERRLGNEQMEHSVDPPFSARLTGGLVARFLSRRPRFGLPSWLPFASTSPTPLSLVRWGLSMVRLRRPARS